MMAILIPGERLGRTRVAGLMLGFAGVGVLMQSRASGFDAESLRGVPLMLLATVFYAASAVSIRRWFRGVRALPLTVAQIGFAALYLVPLAVATGAYDDASMGWQEWLSLLGLGGAGSGIVVVLYMWLIGQVGPVRAAVVTYLMPPVGIFLGWLLLDEEVSWPMVAGVILIFAGVAAVQGAGLLKGRAEARRSANAAT
jgi:drug/metabolite transporter (DMT)-like permease